LVGKGEKRTIYGELQVGQRGNYMAYDGDLKYIYSAGDQKEYLLDHRVDPQETRNCATNVMYAQEIKQMRSEMINFLKADDYTDPLDGDAWKTFEKITLPDSPDAGLLIQDAGWAVPFYDIPGYSDDVKIRP